MSDSKVTTRLAILAVVIAVEVIGGYFTYKYVEDSYMWFSILLVLVTLTTYFGFLMLPGGFREETGFTESRIRLAIASTLTLTYLVYFCTVVFFSDSATQKLYNKELLETLTGLLKIVLPFYFGAVAATEVFQKRSEPKSTSTSTRIEVK